MSSTALTTRFLLQRWEEDEQELEELPGPQHHHQYVWSGCDSVSVCMRPDPQQKKLDLLHFFISQDVFGELSCDTRRESPVP